MLHSGKRLDVVLFKHLIDVRTACGSLSDRTAFKVYAFQRLHCLYEFGFIHMHAATPVHMYLKFRMQYTRPYITDVYWLFIPDSPYVERVSTRRGLIDVRPSVPP